MDIQKQQFLRTSFIRLLRGLEPGTYGRWGKMNGQQMVEHFADSVRIASGRDLFPPVYSGEILEKMRAFLASEKPFRENTKNPILPESPALPEYQTMEEAIRNLEDELEYFFVRFEEEPGMKTSNPIFGELDYDMNVQFLHKHAQHHLRQFGLIE